jgi:hypothetical protein
MNVNPLSKWFLRCVILLIIYFPIWILGTMAVGALIPENTSEPGLIDENIGLLFLGIINTALIVILVVTSRWSGWRLVAALAFAYYGSFTFLTQIESWYFLSETTVPPSLLPRLFLMGLSIPLIYIPLAVLICGKWKNGGYTPQVSIEMYISAKELLLKLGIIAVVYLIIYWMAGYYIAWQNPELRAFYGSPGNIKPFLSHTLDTFGDTPSLIILQLFRGVLFAVIAMPVILGSKINRWLTAVLVGLLFAIPHFVHILPNPLMPQASVRLSHMVETASSSFVFGLFVAWLLSSRHSNGKDLSV